MKTAKEALATHLGWDYADLSDYNYQPGRFTRSIYNVNEDYYCCIKGGRHYHSPLVKVESGLNG